MNRFFQLNLAAEKTFKTPEALQAEWTALLGGPTPGDVVMYCGSGVTACHNLLALEHAGLPGARLFPARGASGAPTRRVPWPPATDGGSPVTGPRVPVPELANVSGSPLVQLPDVASGRRT